MGETGALLLVLAPRLECSELPRAQQSAADGQ